MCIMAATRVPGPLPNQLRVYVIPKWNAFNRSARNPDGAEWPVRDGSGFDPDCVQADALCPHYPQSLGFQVSRSAGFPGVQRGTSMDDRKMARGG